MTEPLWQWDELVAAAEGRGDGTPDAPITGFSIDTRTLAPGDVFVALKAERDGHDFVGDAFKAGAAAALVSKGYRRGKDDGALIRTEDSLAALEAIGRAARVRTNARIVAVTGSAGKTGTKEMLRLCLSDAGPTHASEKSYNNHWGVPLTLARMPKATEFGVFEIGMNHAGEITPLAKMVRPHVAVITTVEPVHLQYFSSVEAIAEAKAEILQGLVPGGTAVLPRDNAHFALLKERADGIGAKIVSFGYARRIRHPLHPGQPRGQGLIGDRRSGLAALSLSRRRARRALRQELARRPGGAADAGRRRHAPPACACTRDRADRPRRAHGARCAGRAHSAHRRELQRQSGLDAGRAGRHGHHAARRIFRAASPCWATCWSWAMPPPTCIAG